MLALAGVRILDFTRAIAGPYCTMLLADLGAEVLKVEPPEGDSTRLLGPFMHGESIEFMTLNRNKCGLRIDLRKPGALDVVMDLVERSDVLVENFRPGAADRLGIGHETVMRANPRLIYCSISGFGHTGPYRDRPAYDLVVQAMGGGMSLTGEPGQRPLAMGIPVGDLNAGMGAALGITAALNERHRTGKGQWIDLSMLDIQVSLLTYLGAWYLNTGQVPAPRGSGNPRLAPYGTFRTAQGYLVLAVWGEGFWRSLCSALGLEALVDDPRFVTNADRSEHRAELIALLEEKLTTRPLDEWLPILEEAGVPHAPIHTVDRALNHPQVVAREMVATTEHPVAGSVGVIGNPLRPSGEKQPLAAAPLLGEHTEATLRDLLGYSDERIRSLKEAGVALEPPLVADAVS